MTGLSGIPVCCLVGMLSIACNTPSQMALPYAFDQPDKVFLLPPELLEISGLTLSADEQHIIAIQDEWGHLFHIDRHTGAVLTSIPFGAAGDYEGVEFVDSFVYVINSSGALFQISLPETQVATFETFLNDSYDVEGLGYDKGSHSLLVACKEHPGNSEDRMVFAFSLAEKQLIPEPVLRITQHEIRRHTGKTGVLFKPSGIARHPLTNEYYLLSAAADMLLILDTEGQIRQCIPLPKHRFHQPEGICFSSDGTLYISDEGGKRRPGSIKVFFPKG